MADTSHKDTLQLVFSGEDNKRRTFTVRVFDDDITPERITAAMDHMVHAHIVQSNLINYYDQRIYAKRVVTATTIVVPEVTK